MLHARTVRALLFLLVLTLSAAAQIHPSLPEPGTLDGLGVNIHFTEPQPGELEMIRAAGFRWVRMDFSWAGTEREAGRYDFSKYEGLLAALEKAGLLAYFILDYGHPKFADAGDRQPFTSRAGTQEFRDAFAKWAVAAVGHLKGRGIVWELWNEPNIAGFWKPKPDAQQYIALAKTVAAALEKAGLRSASRNFPPGTKREAAGECLVGPATSLVDMPFLDACFAAGLLEVFDAISVHPYRQGAPEMVVEEYRALRLLIRRHCAADALPLGTFDPSRPDPKRRIPILSGEWGYSTAWPSLGVLSKTRDESARETTQAKYLPRMFLTNIANDIPLSIWYDWRDDGDDAKEAERRFGIVRRKPTGDAKQPFEPKPAYMAMKVMSEELKGMRYSKRVSISGGPPAYMFGTNSGGFRFVALERYARELWFSFLESPEFADTAIRNEIGKRLEIVKPKPVKADPNMIVCNFGPIDTWDLGVWREPVQEYPARLIYFDGRRMPTTALWWNWQRLPLDYPVFQPTSIESMSEVWNAGEASIEIIGGAVVKAGAMLMEPPPISPFGSDEERKAAVKKLEADIAPRKELMPRETWTIKRIAPPEKIAEMCYFEHFLATPRVGSVPVLSAAQRAYFAIRHPYSLTPLPPSSDALIFKVNRDDRQPWSGTIKYSVFFSGFYSGAPTENVAGSLPLNSKGGEPPLLRIKLSSDQLRRSHARNTSDSVSFSAELNIGDGSVKNLGAIIPTPLKTALSNCDVKPDGDDAVASTQSLADAQPKEGPSISGTPSVRLSYEFADGWKFVRIEPKDAAARKIEGLPRKFGLWVHGDGNGAVPCIRIRDATGQTHQVRGEAITWTGWRYITFPLQPDSAHAQTMIPLPDSGAEQRVTWSHWGGLNDGEIHSHASYPVFAWDSLFLYFLYGCGPRMTFLTFDSIEWDSLFLLDGNRRAMKGEIYLSAPTLVY